MNSEWFAGRLREIREAAGLSRKELADKAGLKLSGVRDLEQGVNKPSWVTVIALCRALGTSPDAFVQEPSPDLPPAAPGRPRKAPAGVDDAKIAKASGDAAKAKVKRRKGRGK